MDSETADDFRRNSGGSPAEVQRPAPLIPAEVDLRDFPYMPLDVQRLRDCRMALVTSGDGFRAAVLLWCAAWHQVPCASLPDDDVELAHLAGFGRFIREFQALKAEALHGFVRCADGRWYHPVIAEKARDAWAAKERHAHEKMVDRARKTNKARKDEGLPPLAIPSFEAWVAGGKRDPVAVPPAPHPSDAGIPPENAEVPPEIPANLPDPPESLAEAVANPADLALKGEGEGEGKGKGEGREKSNPLTAGAGAREARSAGMPGCIPVAEWDAWERERALSGRPLSIGQQLAAWQELAGMDAEGYDLVLVLQRAIVGGYRTFDRRPELLRNAGGPPPRASPGVPGASRYERGNRQAAEEAKRRHRIRVQEQGGAAVSDDPIEGQCEHA